MQASQGLHHPWVNAPVTERDFLSYLKKYDLNSNISYLISIDHHIAGVININEIIRGAFQSGFLGYYAVKNYSGKGIIQEGLKKVVGEAFTTHNLHRLEANIQPDNKASINLVKRCGFNKEGFSPKYLNIMGEWRDHERWTIIKEDLMIGK